MKNLFLFLTISCTFLFPSLLIYRSTVKSRLTIREENKTEISCDDLLKTLNVPISVMLIDVDFLEVLDKDACKWNQENRIKIGVDIKHQSEQNSWNHTNFEIVYYSNDAKKDYLDFDVNGVRRVIPRRFETHWIGNIEIPKDIQKFIEFWKRSKFINCLGLNMGRNTSEKPFMNATSSTGIFARLRDDLLDNGMYPFLNGGSLLGWYRECTVIPHTMDLDFNLFISNYKPEYADKLLNTESEFRLVRSLGKLEESLELTVVPRKEKRPNIDIFMMYEVIEDGVLKHHYTTGLAGDGTKYRYTHPTYDPWCAADMHDHIFWVTCSPKRQLEHEYGPNWHLDHPTSKFSWNSSQKNVKSVGKMTKEEKQKYYLTY